jgi:hypothetical protein
VAREPAVRLPPPLDFAPVLALPPPVDFAPAPPDGGRAPGGGCAPGVDRARVGSARHGSPDDPGVPDDGRRIPGRHVAEVSVSYARWISRNRGSAAAPAESGWFAFARRR